MFYCDGTGCFFYVYLLNFKNFVMWLQAALCVLATSIIMSETYAYKVVGFAG